MSLHNPPHPGEVIRTEIIQAHGLTVTAAAKVLGVSRQALSGLLNAKVDLTGDMALRIEKAFGPKMETLMRMQSAFDIFQARQRASQINVRPFRSAEPFVPAR
jgi:addiction module HigA family antidote